MIVSSFTMVTSIPEARQDIQSSHTSSSRSRPIFWEDQSGRLFQTGQCRSLALCDWEQFARKSGRQYHLGEHALPWLEHTCWDWVKSSISFEASPVKCSTMNLMVIVSLEFPIQTATYWSPSREINRTCGVTLPIASWHDCIVAASGPGCHWKRARHDWAPLCQRALLRRFN